MVHTTGNTRTKSPTRIETARNVLLRLSGFHNLGLEVTIEDGVLLATVTENNDNIESVIGNFCAQTGFSNTLVEHRFGERVYHLEPR